MGYSHYWSRRRELDAEAFTKAAEDVRLLVAKTTEMGIQVAGPTGEGKPGISAYTIAFNGASNCDHRYRDIGKPYAAENATGVEEKEPPYDPLENWGYSGPYLQTRVCNGVCAAEAFVLDRSYMVRDWERAEEGDFYACSCETHFKPYDLLVTAALVRIKERLGTAITISSENPKHGFEDAQRLCRQIFGWASRFEVHEPKISVLPNL